MKIKKGDKVTVIAGKDRGKSGTVSRAMPREDKVVIDGLNIAKRHRRANRAGGKGQIIEIAMPIHVSNVKLSSGADKKPAAKKTTAKKTAAKKAAK